MTKKRFTRVKFCTRCGKRARTDPICQVVRARWKQTDWICLGCADVMGFARVDLGDPDGLAKAKARYPKDRLL